MRIWDVSPGYLNRQSLLGEHRELHGLYNILAEGKKGYSRHPETLRWVGALNGLVCRHAQLSAEMTLRGYRDRTPLALSTEPMHWPESFVTPPLGQYNLLRDKYRDKEAGRIPLPRNVQQFWAQHKYSVMARDPDRYRRIGHAVAGGNNDDTMDELARELVAILRKPPPVGRLENAIEHLWGHVKQFADREDQHSAANGQAARLTVIQRLARENHETFLLASTALAELAVWLHPRQRQA